MSVKSAQPINGKDLPDLARRALSMGLGLFPVLPLLPACSGSIEGDGQSASSTGQAADTSGSTPTGAAPGASAPAAAPAPVPASVSGVFRHPGLLLTEDAAARIRAHIKAGQEPWASWWSKLRADSTA